MKFKLFSEKTHGEKTVMLRCSQRLFISDAILSVCGIKNPKECAIYIDNEKPLIALKFYEEVTCDMDVRKVILDKTGVCINIGKVLKFYGLEKIKKKVKLKFLLKHTINDSEVIVVSLESLVKST